MLTKSDVKSNIRLMLGANILGALELTETDYIGIINSALSLWSRQKPLIKHNEFNVVAGKQKYEIEDYGLGIIDVSIEVNVPTFRIDEFDIIEINHRPPLHYVDSVYHLYGLESMRTSMGLEFDWEFRKEVEIVDGTPVTKGYLYIRPKPSQSKAGSYVYLVGYDKLQESDVDNDDIDLKILPEDEDQFLKYCLAKAKQIVGMARRKWNSELQMDGPSLFSEGTQEEKEVRDWLNSRASIYLGPRQG